MTTQPTPKAFASRLAPFRHGFSAFATAPYRCLSPSFLAAILSLAACEALASDPAINGGSGSSHKTAIVVHASSAAVGIRAQDAYLKAHYPGYRLVGHAFAHHNGKWYDIVAFIDARAKKRSLYFDVSEYFKPM